MLIGFSLGVAAVALVVAVAALFVALLAVANIAKEARRVDKALLDIRALEDHSIRHYEHAAALSRVRPTAPSITMDAPRRPQ